MEKEHWKAREKRLRLEAEAKAQEVTETPQVPDNIQEELIGLKEKVKILEGVPHYVLDKRNNIVAYAQSEDEASTLLISFPEGKIQKVGLPTKK